MDFAFEHPLIILIVLVTEEVLCGRPKISNWKKIIL